MSEARPTPAEFDQTLLTRLHTQATSVTIGLPMLGGNINSVVSQTDGEKDYWLDVTYTPAARYDAEQLWACQLALRETVTLPGSIEVEEERFFEIWWQTENDTPLEPPLELRSAIPGEQPTPENLTRLLRYFKPATTD